MCNLSKIDILDYSRFFLLVFLLFSGISISVSQAWLGIAILLFIYGFCKDKNAWVTTAYEIYKWWEKREKSKFEYTYKDGNLKITPSSGNTHFIKIYKPKNMDSEIVTPNVEIYNNKDSIILKIKNYEKDVKIKFK